MGFDLFAFLHVIHLDQVPRFRLPSEGILFSEGEKKEEKKERKEKTLCAILVEFDGDSFEPECSYLKYLLKPVGFETGSVSGLTEVCCGMQMYGGRLVPVCLLWS